MKKILFGAAVVAAAGFGTFTANQNNNQAQMSDLQLENVEILAADGDSMIDHMWEVGKHGFNDFNDFNGGPKKEWPCPGQPIEWVPAEVFGRTVVAYDCFCNQITYSEVIKRCE